jgi:beta-lactamase class A
MGGGADLHPVLGAGLSARPSTRTGGGRRLVTVAVAALTLAAAGCSGEDAPAPSVASPRSSAPATSAPPSAAPTRPVPDAELARAFADLESRTGARLGVYALDTGTGTEVTHRSDERFPYASTIKALAAAAVLADLEEGGDGGLDSTVRYGADELVEYSPVTELHVTDGLSLREVIDAAVTVSDNTAGNLLLDRLGGPEALDAALVADVGDDVTAVVRREPDLNTAVPGDPRDTSTPRALASALGAYVLGDALTPAHARLLERTMRRTSTGDALVRAGVPSRWRVADKTGTASYGTRNDVAIVRPPGRDPIVLAVLTTHDDEDTAPDDDLVAAATRIVVDGVGRPG